MEKKILVIGDLHITDRYAGKNERYLSDVWSFCDDVTERLKKGDICQLVLTGDIIGVGAYERTVKARIELGKFIKYLREWGSLTGSTVVTLQGNHDVSLAYTDFDFLVQSGFLARPEYIDYANVRLHLFDYGCTQRAYAYKERCMNVGVFHADLTIAGQTDWYYSKGGTELSSLTNLKGLSLAIAGHIHDPSRALLSTAIEGEQIYLYYPGSPSRSSKNHTWQECYGLEIGIETKSLDVTTFHLKEAIFTDIRNEPEAVLSATDLESLSCMFQELAVEHTGQEALEDVHRQVSILACGDTLVESVALHFLEESTNKN